ncbi:hypothetical protein B9T31_09710 [Acinetobacter sp. ANC 4558]|uniref:hypothetical protein n=1 Tax=Acinetobacter sp. ANC 4558 TaxID=1977876 RepID=UPI000A33B941|nr:hypothetical protein [Acinetobacter sp. ANC 4558]OTG85859.1 hypothetical protein B9T31_09710 [Acinetobacter sp. ANC 4558]
MKLTPIRFDDTRHPTKKGLADNVISVKAKILGDYSEHGRSYYVVECGFCKSDFDAYKWCIWGGGKRCPHCKALMGSSFDMYQWRQLTNVEEPAND